MKSATAACAGLAIAILSGGLGFYVGKQAKDSSMSASIDAVSLGHPRTGPVPRATISRGDVADLARKLDAEPDPLRRFSTALQQMEAWVDADPLGALSWLSRQPVTARRNEVIALALGQWSEKAPADAAAWSLQHLIGVDLKNTLIRVAEQWVQDDPASAARWFAGLPDPQVRTGPLEGLFFLWGAQDPQSARAFLDDETVDARDRAILTQALLAGWAKSDPQGASALSLETSRRTGNPGLFANTLANWATMDVASSASWLEQHVPEGPERDAAIPQLAGMFAHHDPASGLEWIKGLPGHDRPTALNALASAWAQDDPGAAARWLTASSDAAGLIAAENIAAIVIGFLAADESAFEHWKNALPPGPLRQQAEEYSRRPEE